MKTTSTLTYLILSVSTTLAFICSYFMELTATNIEQYFSIVLVIFADGFFGVVKGCQIEGFKTYKALKILKTLFFWVVILTIILSIEKGFSGTSWLSETILAPFLVFQIISVLKNASMSGFISNHLLNVIMDRIDRHKNPVKNNIN